MSRVTTRIYQICVEDRHSAKLPHRLQISLARHLMASLVQIARRAILHKHPSEGPPSWKVCTKGKHHASLRPSEVSQFRVKTLNIRSLQFSWQHDLQILSGTVRIVIATIQDAILEDERRGREPLPGSLVGYRGVVSLSPSRLVRPVGGCRQRIELHGYRP